MKKTVILTFLILCASLPASADMEQPSLTKQQKILHVLNRLTFGPEPRDIARVKKIGIPKFIEEQLNPEKIQDSQCEKDLKDYKTLKLSNAELYKLYPPAEMVFKKQRAEGNPPTDEEVKAVNKKHQIILQDLTEAKLIRMVESRRQLLEVMDDFWFNHFNVSFQKNKVKWFLPTYEREVIRPRALGKFKDLLYAVAHSAAMLEYLDNAQSVIDARYVAEDDMMMYPKAARKEMSDKGKGKKKRGLNENYARELMELHTLGVDGGYSQKDVIEVARILTGWSYGSPQELKNGKAQPHEVFGFKFRANQHDQGVKTVMGKTYGPNGGEEEGSQLLDFLCEQPQTARFISRKLCRKFVCDNPPQELVDRVSKRFRETGGDIKQTLRAIFESPEFLDPQYYRAKVKSPAEFMASTLRVTGARLDDPLKVSRALYGMGEPLYLCEPPTGYPDEAKAWVNSSALLNRLNFSKNLLRQNSEDSDGPVFVDLPRLSPHLASGDGKAILKDFFKAFLGGDLSASTREVLLKKLDDPEISHAALDDQHKRYEAVQLGTLVLGSPEFQRR